MHFETFALFRNKNPKIKCRLSVLPCRFGYVSKFDYLVRNSGLIITDFFVLSSEFIQLFLKIKKNNCKFVIIANYHLSLLWIMATFPVKRCYNPYNTFHCKRNQKENPIQNSVNYTFSICHISFAYSAMVRSELNLPAEQIFSQHFFANASSLL